MIKSVLKYSLFSINGAILNLKIPIFYLQFVRYEQNSEDSSTSKGCSRACSESYHPELERKIDAIRV
jgi:hypothetical protein